MAQVRVRVPLARGNGVIRRLRVAAAVVLASSLVLTACGGSGSSSTGSSAAGDSGTASSSGAASGPISAATLTKLKQNVAAATKVPQFRAPGPPVDVSAVRGKTVYAFPINSGIDTCQYQVEAYAELGKKFGMKVITFNNQGTPTDWATGVKNAISRDVDLLAMFCGVPPGAVTPQLMAARQAGIKILDHNYNGAIDKKSIGLIDAATGIDTVGGMRVDVDAAVANLNGKPVHALVVSSKQIPQGPAAVKAVQDQVEADCPDVCTVEKVINIPVADWATKTESEISSALLANEKINAVFLPFDGMAMFAVTGVERANRSGQVKIYAWGNSLSTIKLLAAKNGVLAADTSPSVTWNMYTAMDQTIRLLAGEEPAPVERETPPNRFWTPDTAHEFLTSSGGYNEAAYGGTSYQNAFRKLWGAPQVGS